MECPIQMAKYAMKEEIESLKEENALLRAALCPFVFENIDPGIWPDGSLITLRTYAESLQFARDVYYGRLKK